MQLCFENNKKSEKIAFLSQFSKPGGLNSRDQSRSIFLDLLRPTLENRGECPSCHVQLFFFSVEIFKTETFQSRLGCVEIFVENVEINRDCRDFSRFIEISGHYRDFLRYFRIKNLDKIKKSWSRNVIKLTNSWSRLRQTVKICQKCHFSTDFSISIDTFGTGRWCRDKIKIYQSQLSRLTFWKCQDFLDCQDRLSASVEIESLDRESRSRQIETPRLTIFKIGSILCDICAKFRFKITKNVLWK